MNRRDFLKKSMYFAAGISAWGALPSFMSQAYAQGNGTKVLFINLNGGWDTLSVIQPAGGAVYNTFASMRPTLKTDPAALLSLSSQYGLHPAMTTFKNLYDEGKLATVFNLGYDNMSRSHQDAEVAFARGVIDRKSATSSGFINRLGSQYKFTSLQAVSVSGNDPAFAGGSFSGIQTPGLSNYYFRHFGESNEGIFRQDQLYSISKLMSAENYKPRQADVINAVDLAVNTSTAIKDAVKNTTFTHAYPNTALGRNFKDADILFSQPSLGTEIAYIRRGGFDTHSNQAATLNTLLTELNSGLDAFVVNMKAKGLWDNLIVVIFSEFGRTNKENDSQGTDHGGASTAIVAGNLVRGGIYGELQPSDLTNNGWLPQRYYTVELYRQIIQRMSYDPNSIFAATKGPSLGGLFI